MACAMVSAVCSVAQDSVLAFLWFQLLAISVIVVFRFVMSSLTRAHSSKSQFILRRRALFLG